MASDDHVAAALHAFAKEVMRSSRADPVGDAVLSDQEADVRRRRLHQLATDAEDMAARPQLATYQAFEQILKEAQELGAQVEPETIIPVASAFMQRPHVRLAMRSERSASG
jgi:hypothetical protein